MNHRWEYKRVHIQRYPKADHDQGPGDWTERTMRVLNGLGANGWELVQIVQNNGSWRTLYFKRRAAVPRQVVSPR